MKQPLISSHTFKKKNLNSVNLSNPMKKYLIKGICIHIFMEEIRCSFSTCDQIMYIIYLEIFSEKHNNKCEFLILVLLLIFLENRIKYVL